MSATSGEILSYLALLADPDQNRITAAAWTILERPDDLVWAGWQPDSVVSVPNPPPPSWYQSRLTRAANLFWQARDLEGDVPKIGVFGDEPRELTQWTPPPGSDDPALERLAGIDELHREESLARVGWLWIAGSIDPGTGRVPCLFPLFEREVRLVKIGPTVMPQWLSSLRPHRLVANLGDDRYHDALDRFISEGAAAAHEAQVGRLVEALLAPTGVALAAQVPASTDPMLIGSDEGTVLVPGTGFYINPLNPVAIPSGHRLHRWGSARLNITAFAEVYRADDASQVNREARPRAIRSALPLNERQRAAVARLDREPVVAASGPPGTGKTHMIVAAASDAVARGMSVLVATKSDFAAESVCELLAAYPTPPHLRFGREEHRRAVAEQLSSGTETGLDAAQLQALERAADDRWSELELVSREVLTALERKHRFETGRLRQDAAAAALVPRVLDDGFDLADLDAKVANLAAQKPGFFRRRAERRLRDLVGAASRVSVEDLARGIEAAKTELDIRSALEHARGSELDRLWDELERLETAAKATQADLDTARRARPDRKAMASIAALATSLRSSDGDALDPLMRETDPAFLRHLPLWIGTLDEIEDTLPAVPAMFDLVIFDEASQIDQISAAPALCRAKRAFVVGDPKQLRHRCDITAEQVDAALHHAGLPPGPFAQILAVQHNSLFDLAAAATPVTWLDEHFRSVPHLIQFSSDRYYDGALRLMTQHPRNEGRDSIDPIRVDGTRADQVNPTEVVAVVDAIGRIDDQHQAGAARRSIGVVTPFTGQADAIQSAVLDRFDYQAIRNLGLRVGTVHGLQGTERDVIVLSLMIDGRDFEAGLPIIEDPHLFNVMTTRAREQMIVVHSFDPHELPRGVLADWFRYQDNPPRLSEQLAPVGRWTTELAEALRLGGLRVITGYPVAGWSVDLAVGEGATAFGVETSVHPDGPEAHAERHLTLRRAGWHLVSAFESSWLLEPQEAAIQLATLAAQRSRHA